MLALHKSKTEDQNEMKKMVRKLVATVLIIIVFLSGKVVFNLTASAMCVH